MNEPLDPNPTADAPTARADSLEAGLAAGFGKPEAPRSSLGDLRPVLLKEAEGENAHVVKPTSDAMPPPEQTGDRYQLQGEIARGGMGAILRGRDVDLGRDLAVKVLLEKYAHRPEVARRFIEEAQIGGQLQHPGVVPVYDIGRFGDRPFFTMKLVKGQTLAAMLSERANVASDRPRMLGIVLRVSQTLAYAHAKAVIHRDLKPANIMVGAFGEVQVMDWGLAKVLAEGGIADEERASRVRERPEDVTTIRTARSSGSTGHGTNTEAGSLLGTPAYMPPEQANGDVANLDRRADVFGLGAILCEVLTGKPPYVGRTYDEVHRKAAKGDLGDACARLEGCGADHELIALTKSCLSSEAIDRPKDAQAVTDALITYLDGVQERLRQAELAEAEAKAKATEEAKRRRLTLALAATVVLALTLGGGSWLWVKADRDARQAQLAQDVNHALTMATALRERAKTAIVGGAALFGEAREQAQRALALVENGPADDALKAQVRQLQDELDEEEKDRKLIAAFDEARSAQAETLSENRYATERAVPIFRKAFAAFGLPAGQGEPTEIAARVQKRPPAVREIAIAALEEWIDLVTNPKLKITEPELDWLRAVVAAAEPADAWGKEFRAALTEPDVKTRLKTLEKLAADVDVRQQNPRTLTRLARQLANVNSGSGGRSGYPMSPAALQMLRRAQEQHPANFWINHDLGMGLLYDRSSPAVLNDAVRFMTAAVALRPDSPGANLNLGNTLARTRQFDKAFGCYEKAIQLDPNYAAAHDNLGGELFRKSQLDKATASYLKAIQLAPKSPSAYVNLGTLLQKQGKPDEAMRRFQEALALDEKHPGAHHGVGGVWLSKGKFQEALPLMRQAFKLDRKDAKINLNLGIALAGVGQTEEAIKFFHQSIALDPEDGLAHYSLGNALHGKNQIDDAIACWRTAIKWSPKFALAHVNLANALVDKNKLAEAIDCYREALKIDENLILAHSGLAIALYQDRQLDDAIEWHKKTIALDGKHAGAHSNLGLALADKGDWKQAIEYYKKAIELDQKDALPHYNWGIALAKNRQPAAAIPHFNKAIELDKDYAPAHGSLALALEQTRQWDAAIKSYEMAIELAPKDPHPLFNLGDLLSKQRKLDAAIDCYKKVIAIDPEHYGAHVNLGVDLSRKREWDEAFLAYRKAIQIRPMDPAGYLNLGVALKSNGQLDEAIVSLRKAVELAPKDAEAQIILGSALREKGQKVEAIACYRKAIELGANDGEVHAELGQVLLLTYKYAEARDALTRALKLLPGNHPIRGMVDQQVHTSERFVKLEQRLPDLIKGAEVPTSAQESVSVARLCRTKQMYAASTRFFTKAFAVAPKLADDLNAAYRYDAACYAALAAAGQGEDAAELDDQERARLRKQALDWLRADLPMRAKTQQQGRLAVVALQSMMKHWQTDTDLSSVRDDKELRRLPKEEQDAWIQFWADVEVLRKTVAMSYREETLTGKLNAKNREQAHELKMTAGTTYIINMTSRQFDTNLRLEDAKKKILRENDDINPPNNLNSRIVFTATEDGVYSIIATSFQQSGAGMYTLVIREFRN